MTRKNAQFDIVKRTNGFAVIRDVGPHDTYPTVTNDAEGVFDRVLAACNVPQICPTFRVFYYDSEGDLAEIVRRGGGQISFATATEDQIK